MFALFYLLLGVGEPAYGGGDDGEGDIENVSPDADGGEAVVIPGAAVRYGEGTAVKVNVRNALGGGLVAVHIEQGFPVGQRYLICRQDADVAEVFCPDVFAYSEELAVGVSRHFGVEVFGGVAAELLLKLSHAAAFGVTRVVNQRVPGGQVGDG